VRHARESQRLTVKHTHAGLVQDRDQVLADGRIAEVECASATRSSPPSADLTALRRKVVDSGNGPAQIRGTLSGREVGSENLAVSPTLVWGTPPTGGVRPQSEAGGVPRGNLYRGRSTGGAAVDDEGVAANWLIYGQDACVQISRSVGPTPERDRAVQGFRWRSCVLNGWTFRIGPSSQDWVAPVMLSPFLRCFAYGCCRIC